MVKKISENNANRVFDILKKIVETQNSYIAFFLLLQQ